MTVSTAKPQPSKVFVCGWPVDHSLSPVIHSFWLDQYGIDGSYVRQAVRPDEFPQFIEQIGRQGFAGGNITIPHKETALELVDQLDDAAAKIGAVNTVWLEDENLIGGNTDWIGFCANLDDTGFDWYGEARTALVIGAGGASRAILYALLQRGFASVLLANRTVKRAEDLATDFCSRVVPVPLEDVPAMLPNADLVMNTSSMGMKNAPAFPRQILDAMCDLKPSAIVTDIVYTPLATPLIAAARKLGRQTVDGRAILLHPAAPGFEQWSAVRPD